MRTERIQRLPSRWQRFQRPARRLAAAGGYLVIVCLPATAWLLPPPPHAQSARTARSAVPSGPARLTVGAMDETINVLPLDTEVDYGRQLYLQSCASCHGSEAQGLPHQGVPLTGSEFLSRNDDAALLEFLQKGRAANDPQNKLGLLMPPRGNPPLRDTDLQRVISYLRHVQGSAAPSLPIGSIDTGSAGERGTVAD